MKIKKFRITSILLLVLGILLNIITSKIPWIVEKYYSNGINIYIVKLLSKVSSLVPFSLFEMLIYIVILAIVIFIIYSIVYIIKNPKNAFSYMKSSILNIISVFGIIYFIFVTLWGINYSRIDLKTSLIEDYNKTHNKSITKVEYDKEDLNNLYKFLIKKCNETRELVLEDEDNVMKCKGNYKEVLSSSRDAYENVTILNLDKRGEYATPKPILNSKLLCYTGITGIYSPFTGEANINIAVPDIYLAFTILHEMAHQRGYASEDEANFLAYIACINNKEFDFRYSGYIMALKYTSSAMATIDYENYKKFNKNLSPEVTNDLKDSSEFWKKYDGKISKASDKMNSTYLKSNGVKEGTESYGKIVDLLITYYSLYIRD
ncbi:DUF3810 domain-containing protein [Terrisporobacter mayombei]|nr:DUF3810 domain-containing protein [Terrisporobacter mayombei]